MSTTSARLLMSCTAILGSVMAGCGQGPEPTSASPAVSASSEVKMGDPGAWQASLPEGASYVTTGPSTDVRGCVFTIGGAGIIPPLPPQWIAWVQRTPGAGAPGWCTPGYVIVGTAAQSFGAPDLVARRSGRYLVADFTTHATPSGESPSVLAIVSLEARSGDIVRHAGLAAFPEAPGHGNIYDGALALAPNGTLTVTGTKDSRIPGEIGSGFNDVAVWNHFLSGKGDNPPPTSVTAY